MKRNSKIRSLANNLYDFYIYPEKLITNESGYKLTQGVYDIVTDENIGSILDIIIQHKKNFDLELWYFSRNT